MNPLRQAWKVLHHLTTFKMTARQYLLYQTLGSIAVNGGFTAWNLWSKRELDFISFSGRSGVALDTALTTFVVASLTVVFGTVAIRRDYRVGRFPQLSWTPRNHPVLNLFPYSTLLRAAMFGGLFTVLLSPLVWGAFELTETDGLTFWKYSVFKLTYVVVLGMVVTPLNALWVLTRPRPPSQR